MRLYLITHGHTAGADGRCIGQYELPLGTRGVAAMHALGDDWRAARPTRMVTSDSARAREAAQLLHDRWGTPVEVTERLRDLDFGEWDGREWSDIERDDPDRLAEWSRDWTRLPAPGGESFGDVIDRVAAWWELERGTLAPDDVLAVVAHTGSVRALLCVLLDLPPERAEQLGADAGRVAAVQVSARGAELLLLNADRVPEE